MKAPLLSNDWIVSRRPPRHAVTPDRPYAWFVEPDDFAGWREAMRTVLTDDDCWRRLRRGTTAQASQFTWRRSAELTWQTYQRILAGDATPSQSPISARAA